MKPLSEQEWREKIIDLVYDAIEYGEELHTGHVKTDKEIKKDFGKLLSTVDSIVDLILSDRQAWGEYVIGKDICTCGCNFGDGCLCLPEKMLRAEQRQRNTSGRNK